MQQQWSRSNQYADQVEVDRLLEMGGTATHDKFSGELGTQLSAKFVFLWKEDKKDDRC